MQEAVPAANGMEPGRGGQVGMHTSDWLNQHTLPGTGSTVGMRLCYKKPYAGDLAYWSCQSIFGRCIGGCLVLWMRLDMAFSHMQTSFHLQKRGKGQLFWATCTYEDICSIGIT